MFIKTSFWLIFLALDQTSLQDVICTVVEDNDHQELTSSAADVPPTAEDQQVEDVQLQDLDSPVSPSAGVSASHLLRQLDCDKITRIKGEFTVKT